MSGETGGQGLAEAIWEALDRAHDGAWHVHAAECCWSFPGSIQAITEALAAHTPPAPVPARNDERTNR